MRSDFLSNFSSSLFFQFCSFEWVRDYRPRVTQLCCSSLPWHGFLNPMTINLLSPPLSHFILILSLSLPVSFHSHCLSCALSLSLILITTAHKPLRRLYFDYLLMSLSVRCLVRSSLPTLSNSNSLYLRVSVVKSFIPGFYFLESVLPSLRVYIPLFISLSFLASQSLTLSFTVSISLPLSLPLSTHVMIARSNFSVLFFFSLVFWAEFFLPGGGTSCFGHPKIFYSNPGQEKNTELLAELCRTPKFCHY